MLRAAIFSDIPGSTLGLLSKATLEAAAERDDFEVVAFVTATPGDMSHDRKWRTKRTLRHLAMSATGGPVRLRPPFDLERTADRAGIALVIADNGINDSDFISKLTGDLGVNVLLSYFCVQIVKAPLLDAMDQAVNFHDGLLPHYGGLGATAHSLYNGDTESGYTFHRMTTGVDDGPVLIQETLPVQRGALGGTVQLQKAKAAAARVPELLELMVSGAEGTAQQGEGSYYSMKDMRALTRIEDPARLTQAELERRLAAFNSLKITIDGRSESVTGVGQGSSRSPFAFVDADGCRLRATRIAGLPARLTDSRRRVRALTTRRSKDDSTD